MKTDTERRSEWIHRVLGGGTRLQGHAIMPGAAAARSGPVDREAARIAVLGTFGNANLGDDAILSAFLEWVRREAPSTRIVSLSARPQDVTRLFGIEALDYDACAPGPQPMHEPAAASQAAHSAPAQDGGTRSRMRAALRSALPGLWSRLQSARPSASAIVQALRRFPARLRLARSLDGFVILGGGQIYDHWGGPLGHPLTLLAWSLACRVAAVPLVVLSVGGRPVQPISARLLRRALAMATYVSFRDPDTTRLVRGFGLDRPVAQAPDLAFGLSPPAARVPGPPRVVGVSPMAYRRPGIDPEASEQHYQRYLATLADLCHRLDAAGFEIVMFPSQTRSDQLAIADLCSGLEPAVRQRIRVREVESVDDLLRCIAETDAMIATRFHGVLLSLVSSRPVVSISYQPRKNDRLLEPFGLERFALAIDGLDSAVLWQAFGELIRRYEDCTASIARTLPSLRAEVDAQYRSVFERQGWPLRAGARTVDTHPADGPAPG